MFKSNNVKNSEKLLLQHPQQNMCFDDEDGEKYCICVMLAIYAPDRDGFLNS